jgi:ADP-ribosylglycohydrolase/fructose-1,6-bisphosphatase/inositol monophosphatase family enzyme
MKHDHSITLPEPADLINAAAISVIAAGALLRAEFHRPDGPRGSNGTAPIDGEIEDTLRRQLTSLHPCDWHGEELPREETGHPDVWVVDPQDGTRAFLKGLRGSAISVALVRAGRPVLGIVYAPVAPDDIGDFFMWADGLPAIRNGAVLSAIGSKPAFYRFEGLGDSTASWPPEPAVRRSYDEDVIIGLNEEAGDYAAFNHKKLAPAGALAIPSIAYRLALAAAGEVDAAVSLTVGLDSYDVAGGQALLAAVGGTLVELDGTPIRYDRKSNYRGCLGGRPEIVREVLKRNLGAGTRANRNPTRPRCRTESFGALRWAQGTLLGQLAGDALGSYVEFQSAEIIRQRHPEGVVDIRPGGHWGALAGQPTDDSEMALVLARTIVAKNGFNRDAVATAYVAWGDSKPFDMGGTTAAGLNALRGPSQPNLESQSNGALMRVSPIGIYSVAHPELAARLARADASLTHPHPVCLAASAAFTAAIAAGIGGADNRTMWSIAHAYAGDDGGGSIVRKCLEHSISAGPEEFMRNQGWVLTALGNAFHRLWVGQSLEMAVIETVASGGDTDTNAAICGALLGAAQGREAVPLRWRRKILSCRAVPAAGAKHPRPPIFWPDDALDLAEALLTISQRPGFEAR